MKLIICKTYLLLGNQDDRIFFNLFNNFYVDFPNECRYYSGPHSQKCLKTLWDESGCAEEGKSNPANLNDDTYEAFSTMNLL